MKEITTINDAKQIMKKLNIVIYGSIRNIETDFTTSFSNIDAICNYFNNVYIIILENDSSDNTRTLLVNWSKVQSNKLQKHIILKNNLDDLYPLRAHRLAYCRNTILNYIVDNNLHLYYQYAMHCDLDDRFWSVDYNSMCNCFQYDLNSWDGMSCVNTNKDYYDYWALRCEQSWFNINIFSCNTSGVDYTTKVDSFKALLKNTNGLIPVTSSFNGLAIYKMKSIIYCRYSAEYKCSICNNQNRGCLEDNDHIGLHNQMINNNCKLFINTKMYVQSKPNNSISYYDFMKDIVNTKVISQNILLYVLMNNLVNTKGKWIMADVVDSDVANVITNYYNDNLYVFDNRDKPQTLLLNKNVTIINGCSKDNIYFFANSTLLKEEFISFIYINCYKYHDVKNVLYSVYNKINNETIIIFNNLIYFKDNTLEGLKALYEFTQEYEIKFEWLLTNNNQQNTGAVAIKITSTIYFNHFSENIDYTSLEYEKFNWIFYTTHNSDLVHITTKEDAYRHWMKHGKYEGRISEPPVNQIKQNNEKECETFDWETYLELNRDLKDAGINTREEAIRHWLQHGKQENREYIFDWCSYIKKYNLISQSIDTKIKAINHWLDNGHHEIKNNNNKTNPDMEMFDWKFYIHNYSDLKHLDNETSAYTHWREFGKAEGRICNNFRWTNYLLYNKDLLSIGINTEELAIEHWIKYGKKENRKI